MIRRSRQAIVFLSLFGLLSALATGMSGGIAHAAATAATVAPTAVPTASVRPASGAAPGVATPKATARPATVNTAQSRAEVRAAASVAPAGYPTTPPAQICGNASVLSGPANPPAGAVVITTTTDLYTATVQSPPGSTFWLAPGVHTLGDSVYNQVIPEDNDTYIGAPGAIIDGQQTNYFAFTQGASGVTIEYLTIQNFVPPGNQATINGNSSAGWLIQYDTLQADGIAVDVGDGAVIQYNCITANGQTGINGVQGVSNITIDHNEVSYNDTGAYATGDICGCSSGIKLFGGTNAVITNNWVHDNATVAIWGDTNAVGVLIQGNYINNNNDEAIFFETSYNAFINDNNILDNTVEKGNLYGGGDFPVAAIYISESGGDSRLFGGVYSTLEISGNNLDGNYGGVTLWEDANRFCNSVGNTAPGECPIAGTEASPSTCVAPTIDSQPYTADCRWHTQNVLVDHNNFRVDTDTLGCTGTRCGENSLFSELGDYPPWSPYLGDTIEQAITFNQNNQYEDNNYVGNWNFDVYAQGNEVNQATWTSAPYSQDVGSTFTPLPTANALDANTSTLEGSTGYWVPWYSSTVAQSTAEAHSGTHSLQVNITAANGWGVQLYNAPYFPTHPGAKVLSFWAMSKSKSLAVTMSVTWRDNSGNVLQTDNVTIPALTNKWKQGLLLTDAPPGASFVNVALVSATGVSGNTLYLDDFVVADNALDANTATLEGPVGNTGDWVAGTGDKISQSSVQAHSGTYSLKVALTGSAGWNVNLDNAPYFPEIPGPKTVSFWAKASAATAMPAILKVSFDDSFGNVLQTDTVSTAMLTTAWAQSSASLTAPAGTEYVGLELLGASGIKGNAAFFDDVVVQSL